MKLIRSVAVVATLVMSANSANADLLGRDLNGSAGSFEAYYDTVLDITWLADANLAQSNQFGVTGINLSNGRMEWGTANNWIAAMNAANYLGINDWRLPAMYDIDNDGCVVDSYSSYDGGDCGYNVVSTGPQASELSSLFYDTLANLAAFTTSGALCTTYAAPCPRWQNTAPFANLGEGNFYWYGQETTTDSSGNDWGLPAYYAWYFGPSGTQRPQDKEGSFYNAWAVVDGDLQVVPVPGAVWLFGSALGLLGAARHRARA
ncbi:MAG: hypothetical protein QY320_07120 [Gammaproteobacteria bacterium]|nr:MAG: hypothetical protein QY320_07120 [Gammaproteobacteria bacterium]